MKESFIVGDTLPEAYHKALVELENNGSEIGCSDWNTLQKELSMTFVVNNALQEPMISKLFTGDPRSLEQYRQEILYGILDFEVDTGNWEYTYHRRMGNQVEWVVDELKRNAESRRAVISIRDATDLKSDSPACLQTLQYFIRDEKLHCKVLMRSNDAVKAAFMNAFAFIQLQKKIADSVDVPVGSYTHRANSFHAYQSDWSLLRKYTETLSNKDASVTYEYIGDWDEMMEDEKPNIAAMVATQLAKR
jgi:thymidylate synthase